MVFPYPIRISDIGYFKASDIGYRISDIGYRISDTRYPIQICPDNIGYRILDFNFLFLLYFTFAARNRNTMSESESQDIYEGLLMQVESPSMAPLPNDDPLLDPPRSHHQYHEQQKPEASYKAGALLTSISCKACTAFRC